MGKRLRGLFWILFILLMLYIGVSVYFMEHFFLGTTVNGKNAEFLGTEEVMTQVLADAQSYELLLINQQGEEMTLSLEEMGVSLYENDAVKQVKRIQNGFLWPRMFRQQDSYQVVPGISFEEEKLTAVIDGFEWLEQGSDPENAWVEMTEDGYRVHEAKTGTKVDRNRLEDVVKCSVSGLMPELDLREGSCFEAPEITADSSEITELTAQLNHWLEAEVTYTFGPETVVADKAAISGFVTISDYEASIDPEAVAFWVSELAAQRDTYKVPRKFKSTNRGTITVKGGNTGWQINQEQESEALLAHVEQGEKVTKEPAYLRTGKPWSENYDIGDTYIEIDITAQHMWVYVNGKLLIDTDVVTGNMRRGHDTPEMVADIKYKARNAVLRGQGYASPVKYWMPFYGNYGIHDANWRRKFGGDIYLTDGSHGCVNTPRENMQVIFENVEKGTPVVLYY